MYNVTLQPSHLSFTVSDEETILQAALRQEVALPYSCKTGKCDSCVAIVKSEGQSPSTIKTCTTIPSQDMILELELLTELNDVQVKTLPCRIDLLEYASEDVIVLTLRLPPNQRLPFISGQYIDLIIGDIRRSYSIASTAQADKIELHIRKVVQGKFSQYLFEQAKINDLLRLEGPFGTFFRRKASIVTKRPLIFLAGGTGFAPVQSMVQSILATQETTPIWIYWGNQTAEGFYSILPSEWAKGYEWINYHPVCSTPSSSWQGRTGLVHHAVLADFPSLSSMDVFACGSPAMIEAAKSDFIQAGLVPSSFYADAFLPSN
ncbi:FAD-binding oxidoreductase [Leucothrix pacifica]|uniref:CDP-6-deoxy-delta-3,4-glucoseen reductase n=1 Tax=Leucothrix pacifica TaxID=1247513 RepID=A0A317CBR4_9GAMM|nr:FAD-binding oxidoreductase [Leucothrix pacifica]PWQ95807.1 CDP-6-deoxy-delta-3,4-glucoseen reductase [Leucothrix pacifica]